MIWLQQVYDKIHALKQHPQVQRDTLILWANELSALCDRWVPKAPPLQVDRDHEGEVHLCWMSSMRMKSFVLIVEQNLQVSLHLYDDGKAFDKPDPTHDEVKTALRSFFEYWSP